MMKLTDLLRFFLSILLALSAIAAQAQLSIEITGAGANRFPVAISVMEGESQLPRSVTEVIRADLERSGLFSLVELGPTPLPESAIPDFTYLRTRAADAVAVGSVTSVGGGRFEAPPAASRWSAKTRQSVLGSPRRSRRCSTAPSPTSTWTVTRPRPSTWRSA